MLELLKTKDITQRNVVDAVRRINDVILTDHKSIQTLQSELAERDERLLKEIKSLEDKVDAGFGKTNQQLASMGQEIQGTNRRLDAMDQRFESIDQEIKGTNQRLDAMDQRFESIDQEIQGTNQRLDAMDQRFESMDRRFESMDRRFESMDQRFESMDQRLEKVEFSITQMKDSVVKEQKETNALLRQLIASK